MLLNKKIWKTGTLTATNPKKAPLLPVVKPDLGWQRYVFTLLHQSMFTSMACEAALYVYKKEPPVTPNVLHLCLCVDLPA